jgi:hypothetical protein
MSAMQVLVLPVPVAMASSMARWLRAIAASVAWMAAC